MNISRRRFIAIGAGLAATLAAPNAHAKPTIWRGIALGAGAKLEIHGVSQQEGKRLVLLARAEIERLEKIFSVYRQHSAIMRLNKNGLLKTPPPELLEVLSLARNVHSLTQGRFDPTVQPLWALYAENGGQPPARAIEGTRKSIGLHKVEISSTEIRFSAPGMALTLNGIAQGYITDRVALLLREEGLENVVVNLGEISAMGHDANGGAWKIGLAETSDQSPDEFVTLLNRSIATSAPLGSTFDGNTSHIIDPLSGEAVRSHWQRVSVMHKSAAFADGLSTGMVIMDQDKVAGMELGNHTQVIAMALDGRTTRIGR